MIRSHMCLNCPPRVADSGMACREGSKSYTGGLVAPERRLLRGSDWGFGSPNHLIPALQLAEYRAGVKSPTDAGQDRLNPPEPREVCLGMATPSAAGDRSLSNHLGYLEGPPRRLSQPTAPGHAPATDSTRLPLAPHIARRDGYETDDQEALPAGYRKGPLTWDFWCCVGWS